MRQTFLQQFNPAAPVEEGPEGCRPGMWAEFLVGKLDLYGLVGTFELNLGCHRWVSRAGARVLIGFIHKNNQYPNGGTIPTAWLRLSASATLKVKVTTPPP